MAATRIRYDLTLLDIAQLDLVDLTAATLRSKLKVLALI